MDKNIPSMIEFLDIVDEQDQVVGRAAKDDVYRDCLRHRIAHVLIFNDTNEMALQLRSTHVFFCPLHWSTAVGGHVQSGETYEQAALREYTEELGSTSDLVFLGKAVYEVEGRPSKFLVTCKTTFNGPLSPDSNAVVRADFFTLQTIQDMIEKGEKFHPELLFLLKKYFF